MNGMLSITFKYSISGSHWMQFTHDVVNAFNHPVFSGLPRVYKPSQVSLFIAQCTVTSIRSLVYGFNTVCRQVVRVWTSSVNHTSTWCLYGIFLTPIYYRSLLILQICPNTFNFLSIAICTWFLWPNLVPHYNICNLLLPTIPIHTKIYSVSCNAGVGRIHKNSIITSPDDSRQVLSITYPGTCFCYCQEFSGPNDHFQWYTNQLNPILVFWNSHEVPDTIN